MSVDTFRSIEIGNSNIFKFPQIHYLVTLMNILEHIVILGPQKLVICPL